jgi:preprotein translocase subunit SecF
MKRIITFSRFFRPTVIASAALIVFGLVGFFTMGFNLGVDFQAGLIQEVRFAPAAISVTYNGPAQAGISMSRSSLTIAISGPAIDGATYNFPYTQYKTAGDLCRAMNEQVDGLAAAARIDGVNTADLLQSAQGVPQLSNSEAYVIHYLPPDAAPVGIEDVRQALSSLGTASIQAVGQPGDRHFMIRMQDSALGEGGAAASGVISALEARFGKDDVALTRSDYVGSRFSKQLTNQAGLLLALTLLLILIYAAIRFKPQFAIGAVLAIAHDALIMVAFVVWTRMEFNTTTIAAILTILGYSINDTIVVFDRIRENRRFFSSESMRECLNRSISETLSRTIITTATTMLAVISLYIFTTGSMKDFALALLVGMVSGVYSTIFIAGAFVLFADGWSKKRKAKLPAGAIAVKG